MRRVAVNGGERWMFQKIKAGPLTHEGLGIYCWSAVDGRFGLQRI